MSSKASSSSSSSSSLRYSIFGKKPKDKNEPTPRHTVYTYAQTQVATLGFRSEFILAWGDTGFVYVGRYVGEYKNVAIKRLTKSNDGEQSVSRRQARADLVSVLDSLTMAEHPNLHRLVGYCEEGVDVFAVYEYISLGSLDHHLHGSIEERQRLDWNRRTKIAVGVARGLQYLHDKKMMDRNYWDINCANILLDEEYNPKLSCFGYSAKLGQTYVLAKTKGSPGYVAPEYDTTGPTLKTDVYRFGVALLEIFTGRRAFDDEKPDGEKQLVPWAQNMYNSTERDSFLNMADPALQGQYPVHFLHRVLALAIMCVKDNPDIRPLVDQIVRALDFNEPQAYDPPALSPQGSQGASASSSSFPRPGPKKFSWGGAKERFGEMKVDWKMKSISLEELRNFTFEQLHYATQGFKVDHSFGEGRMALVYRGRLENEGQDVLIKRLMKGESQKKKFLDELKGLSRADHPNILKVVGYCNEKGERLLVYEDMPLGSLDHHLQGTYNQGRRYWYPVYDWNVRIKIAAGAALAVEFLSTEKICHEISSSTILVDNMYTPKLSDYDLANVFDPRLHKKNRRIRVKGAPGYVAPEAVTTGQTLETNVYSFGVVLLEIFTGRKPVDHAKPDDEKVLVTWVQKLYSCRKRDLYLQMADPVLQGQYPKRLLQRVLALALRCVREEPEKRPPMREVHRILSRIESQTYHSTLPVRQVLKGSATPEHILQVQSTSPSPAPDVQSGEVLRKAKSR